MPNSERSTAPSGVGSTRLERSYGPWPGGNESVLLARGSKQVRRAQRQKWPAQPYLTALSFSVWVRITSSQSPSEGVGNWHVLVVTTATAGLFSPVRGLIQVTFGDGGKESSLISMVRSSGT